MREIKDEASGLNAISRLYPFLLGLLISDILLSLPEVLASRFTAKEVTVQVQVYDKYIKRPQFAADAPTLLLSIKDKTVPADVSYISENGSQIEFETTPQVFKRFKVGESAIYREDVRLGTFVSNQYIEKVEKTQE